MKNHTLTYLVFSIGFTLNPIMGQAAEAAEVMGRAQTPKTIMESLIQEMHGSPQEARVADVVDTYFDTETMARQALGRHIRALTAEEKQAYMKNFNLFFKKVIFSLAQEYKDAKFESIQEAKTGNEANLKTKVLGKQGKPITLSVNLALNGSQWKVNDVVVENISLIASYRGQFGTTFKKGGIQAINDFLVR